MALVWSLLGGAAWAGPTTGPSAPAGSTSAPSTVAEDAGAARLTTAPAEAPPYGEAPPPDGRGGVGALGQLVRMGLALVAVVLLAYLLLHKGLGALTGRLQRGRLIQVVDRVGLEPKKSLYVVEVGDRYYLVGTTDHGVSCLATLDSAPTRAAFKALVPPGPKAPNRPAAPPAGTIGEQDA